MHRTPHALQPQQSKGIKTVTSIAVRCPTVTATGESLPSGHCYLMLPPTITLRDLIVEKVAAELRKARAGGHKQSTLADLVEGEIVDDDGQFWLHSPRVEKIARRNVVNAFERGVFSVLVDGQLVADLDALIAVTRSTSIAFIVAAPVLA